MTAKGTLRADGLVVARITVDFLQNPVKVHALAAFVDTSAGQTLGYCEGDGGLWSQETMRKLKELREAMEDDIARRVFAGGAEASSGPTEVGGQGLGEVLGTVPSVPDVPSV